VIWLAAHYEWVIGVVLVPIVVVFIKRLLEPSPKTSPHIEQNVYVGQQESKTEQPPPEQERTPRIRFVQARRVLLQESAHGTWVELGENLHVARNAIVAQFKNVSGKEGEQTVKAGSVTANLVFKCSENPEELHISHGTWMGHYERSVTFRSGDAHQLIIALKLTPFVTFENPNLTNPFIGRFHHRASPRHPKAFVLPGQEGEVEITLVDGRNFTVFNGVFDYAVSLEEMSLTAK
jgi:hypothetical protein